MYPLLRFAKEAIKFRNAPPLDLTGTHVSHHMCLPWDIDPWMELNNGRTLTLFDLGRIPLASRAGLVKVLRTQRWGMTVAGSSVRYRQRIRIFERVEMRSRVVCWDDRFVYIEQSMWKKSGDCANHVLIRMAITSQKGIVAPDQFVAAMGRSDRSPPIPDWISAWIAAETTRPWPPIKE